MTAEDEARKRAEDLAREANHAWWNWLRHVDRLAENADIMEALDRSREGRA
jgi:hypothetical protein